MFLVPLVLQWMVYTSVLEPPCAGVQWEVVERVITVEAITVEAITVATTMVGELITVENWATTNPIAARTRRENLIIPDCGTTCCTVAFTRGGVGATAPSVVDRE